MSYIVDIIDRELIVRYIEIDWLPDIFWECISQYIIPDFFFSIVSAV